MKEKNNRNLLVIVVIMLLLIVIAFIVANVNKKDSQFKTVKDIMDLYECDYIKSTNSLEDGFRKDYYVTFKYLPVDNDGNSNENFFDKLISSVITLEKYNLRLIDESHDIIIRVLYDKENNISEYTINGARNYFSSKTIETQKELANDAITTNITVKSKHIESLISNSWIRRDSNLGKATSADRGYSVYAEGYKIKTLGNKVFNIVFTEKYTDTIINNLGTNSTKSEVIKNLGNATYEHEALVGYKTKDFYIFFETELKEVSVYSITEFNEPKNKQFSRAFEDLLKKEGSAEEIDSFLKQVTHIYENFETYDREDDYILLAYPDMGFSIYFAEDSDHILTLYSNYEGEVVEKHTLNDLVNEGKAIPWVEYKLNVNSVEQYEMDRAHSVDIDPEDDFIEDIDMDEDETEDIDENVISTVNMIFDQMD